VWLVHPWCLRAPLADLPPGTLPVAIGVASWHALWPWSEARWAFVAGQQQALAPLRWFAGTPALRAALATASSVHGVDEPHLARELRELRDDVQLRPAPQLFAPVERLCHSFSSWWNRTRLEPSAY
jgi:deoxyribodipyrimidine photo-lyase